MTARRLPLAQRRHLARAAARARIAARTTRPIPAALRQFDPLARPSASRDMADAATYLAVSAMLHGAVGIGGNALGGDDNDRDSSTAVAIEVRERKPEPPPPPPPPLPPIPPPEPERVEREREQPREVAPPPEPPPPEPEAKKPPPRVVGISLDSTGQGGEGPAYGVGNSRSGDTETKAADPSAVGREPAKPDSKPDPAPKPTANKAATRLPVAGAKYVLPKRKNPSRPVYPEQLKSQGIEADVTVMVSLDATGKVTAVKIARGSPYPEFDEAARRAAMSEQFEPAMKDGAAIPYSLTFTYRFRLED